MAPEGPPVRLSTDLLMVSCVYHIRLKRKDFQTLYGMNWLNDEVSY